MAGYVRIKRGVRSLLASRPVTAAVTCLFCSFAGSAATGIAELPGGRAFITVAFAHFMMLVRFSAGTGVEGCRLVLISGIFGIA